MFPQKTPFILVLLFLVTSGHAQQATVAAGGEAIGIGGTMSSSSGQTDFQYISNDLWSLQFGVQQTHKAQVVNIDPDPPEGGTIIGGGNHPIGSEVSLMAQAILEGSLPDNPCAQFWFILSLFCHKL